MAAKTEIHTMASWDEIPVFDKVSVKYAPLSGINPATLSNTHSIAYWSDSLYGSVLLLHGLGNKSYIRGRNNCLGLDGEIRTADSPSYRGPVKEPTLRAGEYQMREIKELRGRRMVQVEFSYLGTVYILTEDGTLHSSGCAEDGLLGRPDNLVPSHRFGAVPIYQAVKRFAVGARHVLAMTKDQVFAFGRNANGQLGVTGCDYSEEPMAVYAGTGPAAPQEVICGASFSVIVTVGRQVLAFGEYTLSGKGLPVCDSSQAPRVIYTGTGPAAPHQVVCGAFHIVILTAGGQVLTCGSGVSTGQGHRKDVLEMSEVHGLCNIRVQEVGSTSRITYALADGIIYNWGGYETLEPTVLSCDGCHITTFRCLGYQAIALTDSGDYYDLTIGSQLIECDLPRDLCGTVSGGLVFLDTEENRQRVFPVLRSLERADDAVEVGRLEEATTEDSLTSENEFPRAEADIIELRRLIKERISQKNDACVAAENRLKIAEAKIAELTLSLEESIERERDESVAAGNRLQTAEAKIAELTLSLEESVEREKVLRALERRDDAVEVGRLEEDACVAAEIRLHIAEAKIAELTLSLEESIEREKAASEALRECERGRVTNADIIDELQQKKFELQKSQHALTEQELHCENGACVAAENGLQTAETDIAELKHSLEESKERKKVAAASEALRQSEHGPVSNADRTDELQPKIVELPSTKHASAEEDVHPENVEPGRLDEVDEIGELRRRFAAMKL